MENAAWSAIPPSMVTRTIHTAWSKLAHLWRAQRQRRSLVVKETAGLGERRFVAIVQFEKQRFLVGGGPGSVTLLSRLQDAEEPECGVQR